MPSREQIMIRYVVELPKKETTKKSTKKTTKKSTTKKPAKK